MTLTEPASLTLVMHRPRRLRWTASLQQIMQETQLNINDLIYPLFVMEGEEQKIEISSMLGCYRHSLDLLLKEVIEAFELGINVIALFPVISKGKKDATGTESYNLDGLVQRTVRAIKQVLPLVVVITDVALDPFSIYSYDGIVDEDSFVLNDPTVKSLGKMALFQAEAGADMVASSDMMDGQVGTIRQALDAQGYIDVEILAYFGKYTSANYGPFRDALNFAPKFGTKNKYGMQL